MKKKIGILILAAGMNTRMSIQWPDTPKALLPINNQPNLFILLESIFDMESTYNLIITIIVSEGMLKIFENELQRWFPHTATKICILEQIDARGSGKAVEQLFLSRRHGHHDAYLVVLQCNFPFIASESIKNIIDSHIDTHSQVTILGGKTQSVVTTDTNKYTRCVIKNNMVVQLVEPQDADEYKEVLSNSFFMGVMIAKYGFFRNCVKHMVADPFTEEFRVIDFINNSRDIPTKIVYIYPMYGSIETVSLEMPDDLPYAEHLYTQKKHASFLHQCYFLWKQYANLDERLKKCEEKLGLP